MAGNVAVLRWLAAEVRRLRRELDVVNEVKVLEVAKRKDKRVSCVFDPEAPSFIPDPPTLLDPGPEKPLVSAFHRASVRDAPDEENAKNSFEDYGKEDAGTDIGSRFLGQNAGRKLPGHHCLSDVFGFPPVAASVKHSAGPGDGGFVGVSACSSVPVPELSEFRPGSLLWETSEDLFLYIGIDACVDCGRVSGPAEDLPRWSFSHFDEKCSGRLGCRGHRGWHFSCGCCDVETSDLAASESPSRFLAEQEKEPEQPYRYDYRRHAEHLRSLPTDGLDVAQAAIGSLFVDVDSLYGVKLNNLAFFEPVFEAPTNPAWRLRVRKNIQFILDEYWVNGCRDPHWVEDQVFYEIEDLRMMESLRC